MSLFLHPNVCTYSKDIAIGAQKGYPNAVITTATTAPVYKAPMGGAHTCTIKLENFSVSPRTTTMKRKLGHSTAEVFGQRHRKTRKEELGHSVMTII